MRFLSRLGLVFLLATALSCSKEKAPGENGASPVQTPAASEARKTTPAEPTQAAQWLGLDKAAYEAVTTVEKQWAQVKSLRSTLVVHVLISEEAGMSGELQGAGTYEMLRQSDKTLLRSDVRVASATPPVQAGISPLPAMRCLFVCDGTHAYQEARPDAADAKDAPAPTVIKGPAGSIGSFADTGGFGDHPLRVYREQRFAIKRLPDEVLESRDAFVFDAAYTGPQAEDSVVTKQRVWFDKQTGALLRIEHHDKDGKLLSWTQFADLEVNAALDPARFSYTPGPDVKVEQAGVPQGDTVSPLPPELSAPPVAPPQPPQPGKPADVPPPPLVDADALKAAADPAASPQPKDPVEPTMEEEPDPQESAEAQPVN